jgi:alpha-ketoglutarate-dependent taurine dioxygenase
MDASHSPLLSRSEIQRAVEECTRTGFSRLSWPTDMPLELLASRLSSHVVDHRRLIAQDRGTARSETLSNRYGLDAFPWHTDAAHHPRPPRLCVMRSLRPTSVPTMLLDRDLLLANQPELQKSLRHGSWIVQGARQTFYTPVIGRTGLIRFNPDTMTPASLATVASHAALTARLSTFNGHPHQWASEEVLIFDNGRMLHARPTIYDSDHHRELERILCELPNCL